jgi:hypothetical protein
VANKTVTEKNLENFISNNYDKKDRRKDEAKKFEWFVNSMHIWHCSSQFYNSKAQIGKEVSLGSAQGGDAFFIIINNEQIFTINDDIEIIVKYLVEKGKEVCFQFIQTKKSENARWGDFLNFIDVVLMILKGENIDKNQKELKRIQNLYDSVTDLNIPQLGKIKHRLELFFYTDKNENDIEMLRNDWKNNITRQENNLKEYISESTIHIRGSSFINDLYEKFISNKYELLVNKDEVIDADESKYIIGFLTAKELLDCIAPITGSGERAILPDVFKNNIRLYIGNTPVNENIEKTLINEPNKFHYYNNGLTITTKEIDCSNAKNYFITPVNIVNGCQTANSIYNVFKINHEKEAEVKIPVKIIVAQDSEYEKITIRTNAQNGLQEKELISITKIQKELEEKFDKMNLSGKTFFYKRQNTVDINKPDIDFILTIDDILRATFSTFLLIPNKVSGYFDYTTSKYLDRIFDENFLQLYSLVTVLLKFIEDKIESNSEFIRLKYHICYLIYKFVNKDINLNYFEEYFRNRTNAEEEINEEEFTNLVALIKSVTTNLYKLLKEEKVFEVVFDYITNKLKTNYPDFLDLSTKDKEKILYKPVEKLYRTRTQPVFENFKDIFSEEFNELIEKINAKRE